MIKSVGTSSHAAIMCLTSSVSSFCTAVRKALRPCLQHTTPVDAMSPVQCHAPVLERGVGLAVQEALRLHECTVREGWGGVAKGGVREGRGGHSRLKGCLSRTTSAAAWPRSSPNCDRHCSLHPSHSDTTPTLSLRHHPHPLTQTPPSPSHSDTTPTPPAGQSRTRI